MADTAPKATETGTSGTSVQAALAAASSSEPAQSTLEPNQVLEADNLGDIEGDSAYGDDIASSTTSITSSIKNYTYENGRRYHAFRDGAYPFPNDEEEQDRLDLLHHIWRLTLDGKLLAAPVGKDVQRVLDVGTGTGIWAIDFADEFPHAVITGVDLSPIQPAWVPPNCKFIVDDVEGDWTTHESDKYDLIHSRAMNGSIKDWDKYIVEIYNNLKPGGWVEIQDYETVWQAAGNDFTHAQNAVEWAALLNKASDSFGKSMMVAREHKQRLIDAGFEDVKEVVRPVPVGPWPKDPKAKEIGRYELVHMVDAVDSYSMALFSRYLGWSRERILTMTAATRSDLRNPKNRLYSDFHFIWARKPGKKD